MKWPRLHRADRLLVAILLPTALLAAVLGYARSTGEGEPDQPVASPTTFSTRAEGARAIYHVWGRVGYDVHQLRRVVTHDRLAEADGLVVLGPWQPMTEEAIDALLAWVGDGGRLLIVPGGELEHAWFDVASYPGEFDAFTAAWDEDARQPTARHHADDEQLAKAEPLLAGVAALTTRERMRFDAETPLRGPLADRPYEVFWQDAEGIIGLRVTYESGELIVLGDSYPLTNIALGQADNSVFAANLAAALTGRTGDGRILFDEYHHGFLERDTSAVAIVRLILDEGRLWAVLQALAVAGLAVFAAGVRFGRPRDLVQQVRPTQRQFIEAGARLLEHYRGTQRVGEILHEHHRRRLCRLLHQPGDIDDTLLARAAADRTGIDITPALRVTAGHAGPASDAELLHAHRTLHRAQEALTHGTR